MPPAVGWARGCCRIRPGAGSAGRRRPPGPPWASRRGVGCRLRARRWARRRGKGQGRRGCLRGLRGRGWCGGRLSRRWGLFRHGCGLLFCRGRGRGRGGRARGAYGRSGRGRAAAGGNRRGLGRGGGGRGRCSVCVGGGGVAHRGRAAASGEVHAPLQAVEAGHDRALVAVGGRQEHARADQLQLEAGRGGAPHLRQPLVDEVGGAAQFGGAEGAGLGLHALQDVGGGVEQALLRGVRDG